MSAAEKEALVVEFSRQFSDYEQFTLAWNRIWDKLGKPSAEMARKWLSEDLERDRLRALPGRSPEADYRSVTPPFEMNDCYHCSGKHYFSGGVNAVQIPCWACTGVDHPGEHCDKCRAFAAQRAADTGGDEERTVSRDYIAELAKKLKQRPKRKEPTDGSATP